MVTWNGGIMSKILKILPILLIVLLLTACNLQAPDADTAATPSDQEGDVVNGTGGIAGRLWHDVCSPPPESDVDPEELPLGCVIDSGSGEVVANGKLDVAEIGIPGVTVTLGEGTCPAFGLATTVSGSDGMYLFSGLEAGTYCVEIDPGLESNAAVLQPGRWTYPPTENPGAANSADIIIEEGDVRSDVYFAWDFELLPEGPLPLTQTPVPSATSEEAPSGTETPEGEDEGTATPTFTATPILVEGDPRGSLGDPTWVDNFTDTEAWPLYDDSNVRFTLEGDKLVMTAYNPSFYNGWMLTSIDSVNSYLEMSTEVEKCSGRDSYGIMFRASTTDKGYVGYLFGIGCDGTYVLRSWDGESLTKIQDWTASEVIKSGSDQTHRIGVWAEGGTLKLYIDGQEVTSITDGTHQSGLFGVYIGSAETPNLTVNVDEFAYWKLP